MDDKFSRENRTRYMEIYKKALNDRERSDIRPWYDLSDFNDSVIYTIENESIQRIFDDIPTEEIERYLNLIFDDIVKLNMDLYDEAHIYKDMEILFLIYATRLHKILYSLHAIRRRLILIS